jgi:hypothetical protein
MKRRKKAMTVIVEGGEISDEERKSYEAYVKDKYKGKTIELLKIKVDGEFVDLETHTKSEGFQRVRRITGYLVGTLDRFNNGKKAEVKDRVPHGVDYEHTVSGLLDD